MSVSEEAKKRPGKCPAGCDRGPLLKPCGKPCEKKIGHGGNRGQMHDCGRH